ncbi:MAG: 16S rRNA (adenine(1518)-N(6)/adenine(1519)-N(6))-dimethyltransferase RsmA [Clostridiales Family XIII bacterium]|jgi:16S rRNA (adenine1518-N6/adenine1519-N6)-dimethyltransferase|nr:16S rRNA (adenine(1518)-N(6)/adenine(1519)-N(6))-dimethyltransferase RsmA [Clostridiales Family XIII bacterium]
MLDSYKRTVALELQRKHGFQLQKNYGQNLLTDANIIEKIVDAGEISATDTVLEIGPGFGALTTALSRRAGKVIAVEIDRKLIPILEEVLDGAENTEIVTGDFMKYDMRRLPDGFKLMGNLPYYITTPIIGKILEQPATPERMVFMVQKEVAERLCAPPGSKTYGAISVFVQYHCAVSAVMTVSKEVFMPKPNVDSAVIVLKPYPEKPVSPKDEKLFFSIVKAGFGQRRKMIRNAIASAVPSKGDLDTAFAVTGIDPDTRAERLSVAEFVALADAVLECAGNET